jgi:hypothetical protein
MGEAKRRRQVQFAEQTVSSLVTMLPPGWNHGFPARYRPQCVGLFLFLRRFGAAKMVGFFANIDSPSLAAFWDTWPEMALQVGHAKGMFGDAAIMTASMLQAALAQGDHKDNAEYRAILAQAAIWLYATAFGGERDLLQRGDVALRFVLEETSSATFDIHTEMVDLRSAAATSSSS